MKFTDDLQKQFQAHLESGETLVINGSLTLEDENLEILPFMRVRGDLTLNCLTRLTRLWGLEVAGHLVIDECDLLESLPRQCLVGKGLVLKNNTLLSSLGEKPSCKYLYMESCTSMLILELGIERCNDITVKQCHNLEIVTQNNLIWIPSEVTIENCGLVAVPSGLKVGTTLKVLGCDKLETVGSEVFSGGDIDLSRCKRLESIGHGLFVGKDLILKNTGLETLPEDLSVEGVIEVEGSPIKNLKKIGEDTKVTWRGKNAGALTAYPMEKKIAQDIFRIQSPSDREHQIRRLGVDVFLRATGERFSRHRMDPDGVIEALKMGKNNAGDLYYISKGGGQWAYDLKGGNKERLPKWNEAGIMMVPGWWEIWNIRKLDCQRN
jgi:hypothetical protein